MPFRLPAELMNRVDKAAAYCGQTRQTFVQSAVLAELAEVEERRRMKQLRASRSSTTLRDPIEDDEPQPTSSTPSGIGISSRKRREIEETPAPLIAQPAPVVVNVGSSNGRGNGGDVDRLASFVVNGSDFDRDTRLRTAVSVLAASSTTEEERKVLAARLDEAVAAKSKAPAIGIGNDSSGVMKAARFAYDKFSDFWNE